ncbi:AAA family ATPase [Persephonella atlantica]|uniref:AAA family ATPase n=1 Tax=Persephonella atlantica TaxID=2699429 RepID=A0ABS1GER5_9AQUI|nr:AAA family ATPase [Persephonella atlantica]MBK3331457.1 AAA family ATPase [Persephonella atlantica]
MTYLEFFGLKEDPFKITPDYRYFYPSKTHRIADNLLNYVVRHGEGFCVIIGEPGTGKTTVIRKFINSLKDNVIYALILTPKLNPEEFLKVVLDDLGIHIKADSKHDLLKKFREFLEKKVSEGKKVLIIVDEAQNLPEDTLEELRLLSNLETANEKLVQIILLGQPELDEKLKLPQLRQLNQRITNKIRLLPLTEDETFRYIYHRLAIAGKGNIRFKDSAVRKIYKYSRGIPRIINILASRSLMSAFMTGSFVIKPENVDAAKETLNPDMVVSGSIDFFTKGRIIIYTLITANLIGIMYLLYRLMF